MTTPPFSLILLPFFTRQQEAVCAAYPRSAQEIDHAVQALAHDPCPPDAKVYPALKQNDPELVIRKRRIALAAYNIGRSGGLRLVWLLVLDQQSVVPLCLYKKGRIDEQDLMKLIKKHLKTALVELRARSVKNPDG